MTDIYNPALSALIEQTDEDWGDPEQNRKDLVPYGIKPFDRALYGLDIYNGELVVVMGQHKNRKTTFAINVLINIMTGEKPVDKPIVVVDSLESGMHPARYRDQMISNVASRILLKEGHYPNSCPKCGTGACQELQLSPEFLRFNNRSKAQQRAIQIAKDVMSGWPVYIFGANPFQGATRNLEEAVKGFSKPNPDSWHFQWAQAHDMDQRTAAKISRWEWFVHEKGAKIFITDHVQQYSFTGEPNDYEKQLRAVGAIGEFVSKWQTAVMMLSQVSLTSVREAKSGGKIKGLGGDKASQEANVVFGTFYEPGDGYQTIEILDSRKSSTFAVEHPLEETSGAFFGEPRFKSGV